MAPTNRARANPKYTHPGRGEATPLASLAPGESEKVRVDFVGDRPDDPSFALLIGPTRQLAFRVRGRVEYRGVAKWTYTTDFDCERHGGSWTKQSWVDGRILP